MSQICLTLNSFSEQIFSLVSSIVTTEVDETILQIKCQHNYIDDHTVTDEARALRPVLVGTTSCIIAVNLCGSLISTESPKTWGYHTVIYICLNLLAISSISFSK